MKHSKQPLAAVIGVVALAVLGQGIVASPAYAVGSSYFVDNRSGSGCSDSNAGTSSTVPWCTFANINSHGTFGAGDQILLARGATWNQQMTITGAGSSSNWITVGAYGSGNRPTIARSGAESDRAIKITNPDYVKFTDLEISNAGVGILATFTTTGHSGLSFQNLYLHDIYGIHQGSGSGSGDGVWNSSGVEITSATLGGTASSNVLSGLSFENIEGSHNLDTVSVDWNNGRAPGATQNGSGVTENVFVDRLYLHDGDAGGSSGRVCDDGMRFSNVAYLTMVRSQLISQGQCGSSSGTAAIYLAGVRTANFFNNIIQDVPATSSPDQVGVDFECCTNRVNFNNNVFSGNAGAGISYLAIHPGTGLETNSEVAGNLFLDNGNGSLRRLGNSDTPSGVIRDNLYAEANYFLYSDGADFSGFTLTNNQSLVLNADTSYNVASQFSGTQGANSWSYQSFNGSSWSNLSYFNSADGIWQPSSNASIPQVDRFGMHPEPCSSCAVAQVWTAPASGTISIRGRVLKTDVGGGDGITATVTLNGTRIWPTSGSQTIAYNDRLGFEQVLDNISVSVGDVIRFEVTSGSANNNSYDGISWAPTVGYSERTCAAENGTCSFSGTRSVRYGSGSTWYYGTATSSISCSNAVFGDPTPGVAKMCVVVPETLPTTGIWGYCADENGTCSFSGTKTVIYGGKASFNSGTFNGSVACSNSAFGDPLPANAKKCYIRTT